MIPAAPALEGQGIYRANVYGKAVPEAPGSRGFVDEANLIDECPGGIVQFNSADKLHREVADPSKRWKSIDDIGTRGPGKNSARFQQSAAFDSTRFLPGWRIREVATAPHPPGQVQLFGACRRVGEFDIRPVAGDLRNHNSTGGKALGAEC